jgi:hypothetical protein
MEEDLYDKRLRSSWSYGTVAVEHHDECLSDFLHMSYLYPVSGIRPFIA